MDYFQGVVTDYLRANRSVFVNTECLIQLDEGNKQLKDRHWFCDAMAVNFKESTVYLCEITYSATMQSLVSRLHAWRMHWTELQLAVCYGTLVHQQAGRFSRGCSFQSRITLLSRPKLARAKLL